MLQVGSVPGRRRIIPIGAVILGLLLSMLPVAIVSAATYTLSFSSEPGSSTGPDADLSPQPVVSIGSPTQNIPITLTIKSGSGTGGAHLFCDNNTVDTDTSGMATFSGCEIDTPGNGYILHAVDGMGDHVNSAPFDVPSLPATQLVFTAVPASAGVGQVFPTNPTVEIEDEDGDLVPSETATITLTATGPGTLSCTGGTAIPSSGGVATFTGCSISQAGTDTLTATATGAAPASSLTPDTSGSFVVSNGTATHLVFTASPSSAGTGQVFPTNPTVAIEDNGGNVVSTETATITLAISNNPGIGVLTCTGGTSIPSSSGFATFTGCSISAPGVGYTLIASASSASPVASLTSAYSPAFTVGAGNQLVFTTQPGGGPANTVWTQQPVVAVENASNQVNTGDYSTQVTIAIATNPVGGSLVCSGTGLTVTVQGGYAHFSGCYITVASTSYYTLSVSSNPVNTTTTSAAFLITGTGNQLVFTTQPGGGPANTVWTQQPVVAVENASNQVNTGDYSTQVTIAIATNPVGGSLVCSGTGLTVTVQGGYAHFSGCYITVASTSYYTLSVSSNPVNTTTTSAAFLITGTNTVTDTLGSATAVGNAQTGFSISTKIVKVGSSITIQITTSPSLAGQRLGIWVAKKTNGVWSSFAPHASVTVGSDGVAYYVYAAGSKVWESFRAVYGSNLSPARQARWI